MNPDDAVITNLNPTEDYKTSVLSGLSPNIIMECTGRALSFWAYQTTQEIVYQQYLARSLTDKYAALSTQMDKVIHDANAEISDLRDKLANMQIDQESLRQKNDELMQAYNHKSRLHNQTQELYDKLKRKAMLGQVRSAATDAVEHVIQPSAISNRYIDRNVNLDNRYEQPHAASIMQPQMEGTGNSPMVRRSPTTHALINDRWTGIASQENRQTVDLTQTPSSHRQRLNSAPTLGHGISSMHHEYNSGTPLPRRQIVPDRQPLMGPNAMSLGNNAFTGYGMSAGVKVSHPTGVPRSCSNAFSRPTTRPRVAQRPSSAFAGGQKSGFGLRGGANVDNGGGAF
ncbi:MAG: hypothetical protein M1818_006123 [Claussenomyces sp. TS43310]|nr:MAG: hypothetical protein M1818_006123 [Claussenomyces sp. TS43310]